MFSRDPKGSASADALPFGSRLNDGASSQETRERIPMRWLLDALYLTALTLLSPWLAYRAIRTGRYRRGLAAKLFGLSQPPLPSSRPVWFHGVSVGEIHLLRQVIAAFRRRRPDLPCVVSTTTDAGYDEARRCFPDLIVFPFPFDFSWAVGRTLRRGRSRAGRSGGGRAVAQLPTGGSPAWRPGRRGQRPSQSAQRRPLPPIAMGDGPAVRLHRPLRRSNGGIRQGRSVAGRSAGARSRYRIGKV